MSVLEFSDAAPVAKRRHDLRIARWPCLVCWGSHHGGEGTGFTACARWV